MLACTLLEEGRDPREERNFRAEQRRCNRWGRWRGWDGAAGSGGGPLGVHASWFKGASRSLFDPRDRGGLGLVVRPLLQQAGIVDLSQLCTTPFAGAEGGGRWLLDRKQVACRTGTKVTDA